MSEALEQAGGTLERLWFVAALLFGGYQLLTGLPDPLALFSGIASVWVALTPRFLRGKRIPFLGEAFRLALVGYPLWLSCIWANDILEGRGLELPPGPWDPDTVAGMGAAAFWLSVLLAVRVHLWRRHARASAARDAPREGPQAKDSLPKDFATSGDPASSGPVRDWEPVEPAEASERESGADGAPPERS